MVYRTLQRARKLLLKYPLHDKQLIEKASTTPGTPPGDADLIAATEDRLR